MMKSSLVIGISRASAVLALGSRSLPNIMGTSGEKDCAHHNRPGARKEASSAFGRVTVRETANRGNPNRGPVRLLGGETVRHIRKGIPMRRSFLALAAL